MLAILFFVVLQPLIEAHSWVGCTNYNPPSTDFDKLGAFDRSRCSGYPRGFKTQFEQELNTIFGIDTGFNWSHGTCRNSFLASDYTDAIPMAQYVSGSIIHISHPAKNHVADTCTNPFIPSTGLKLMMSSQPEMDLFDVSLELIGGEHTNGVIDHLGYQRCFNFCGNPDKSHCITSWKLPAVAVSGRYSFDWVWEFNENEFYGTCFDAMISTDGSTFSPIPVPSMTLDSSSGSHSDNDTHSDNGTITFPPTSTPSNNGTITFPPTATPLPSTATPLPSTATPEPTTETPEPTMETPEPTTPRPTFRITSDATQLRSIFADLFSSFKIQFNGTLNISSIFE